MSIRLCYRGIACFPIAKLHGRIAWSKILMSKQHIHRGIGRTPKSKRLRHGDLRETYISKQQSPK